MRWPPSLSRNVLKLPAAFISQFEQWSMGVRDRLAISTVYHQLDKLNIPTASLNHLPSFSLCSSPSSPGPPASPPKKPALSWFLVVFFEALANAVVKRRHKIVPIARIAFSAPVTLPQRPRNGCGGSRRNAREARLGSVLIVTISQVAFSFL